MFASFLDLVLSADLSFDKAVARCQGPDLEACLALARFYANPGGAHRDDAKAATLLQLLCTKNDGEGCFELGVLYAEGRGVAKDAAKANQLWDKGGTRGSRAAGQALLSGKAGEANPDEAKRLFTLACDGWEAEACALLGEAAGGKKTPEGKALRQRACRQGYGTACR
jgi:TPR repeat protein